MPNIIKDNKYLKKVVHGITTNYVKCLKYESPQSMYFYIQDTSGNPNTIQFNATGDAAVYVSFLTNRTVYYSYDLSQWQSVSVTSGNTPTINIPANGRVYLKCQTDYWGLLYRSTFNYKLWFYITCNGFCDLGGNIMSLLYGDNFVNQYTIPSTYCFLYLFRGNDKIKSVRDLCLPATTLAQYCYMGMFLNCTSLTDAPALPATTLVDSCYATMFSGCTSLTTAPALPATTLAGSCYWQMFYNCTSLTTAPVLPATTLVDSCYQRMFWNCSNLNSITVGATSWNTDYANIWLLNVSATGTFTKPTNTTIPTGTSGIPSGWTVVNV